MKEINELLDELDEMRRQGMSYEQIGQCYDVNRTTIWKIINTRKPPNFPRIRHQLGLPLAKEVHFITALQTNEIDHANIQAYAVATCHCGRLFVPNHPKRKQCFICSPYQGRTDVNTA